MSLGTCLIGSNLVQGAVIWSDNFDSYADGQDLHGVNGWKGWLNNPANTANVSSTTASSSPHSLAITPSTPTSDIVREFSTPGTGVYTFSADTFLATGSVGVPYFIALNTYSDGGSLNWSTQQQFNNTTGLVTSDTGSGAGITTPIIYDKWVPIQLIVDLNANTQSFSYGGTTMYSGVSWTDGLSGGGALDIGAIDLFGNGASVMYYDNLMLVNDVVPEPTSLALLGLSGLAILLRRKR